MFSVEEHTAMVMDSNEIFDIVTPSGVSGGHLNMSQIYCAHCMSRLKPNLQGNKYSLKSQYFAPCFSTAAEEHDSGVNRVTSALREGDAARLSSLCEGCASLVDVC